MAYFPNGTAAGIHEERECLDCVHYEPADDPDAPMCPIREIHFLLNYDQVGNESLRAAMTCLIDDDKKPLGKMCSMRLSSDDVAERMRDNRTADLFAGSEDVTP